MRMKTSSNGPNKCCISAGTYILLLDYEEQSFASRAGTIRADNNSSNIKKNVDRKKKQNIKPLLSIGTFQAVPSKTDKQTRKTLITTGVTPASPNNIMQSVAPNNGTLLHININVNSTR